ncbi:MAG TPA: PEP-CTERM sorting domain-containing protein [Alphaproteobacteria bacterium]|nr:PEP-CTERM sorting domain-containing protein [Alphaproteobacteria bacterium]
MLNVNLGGGTVLDLQPYDAQLEFWANFVGVQDAGGLTTALFDTGGLTISADLGQGVEVMLAMAIGPADGTQGLSILAPTNSRSGVLAAVGVPTDGPDLDDGDLFYGGMVSIVFNVRGSSGSLVRINPALFSSDFTGEADCNVGLTTELIPEPSGLAMLGIGLSGLTAAMKRWI